MSTVYYPAKGDSVQVNGIRVRLNGFEPPKHLEGTFQSALKMGILTTVPPVIQPQPQVTNVTTESSQPTIKISLSDASDITASNSSISMADYGYVETKEEAPAPVVEQEVKDTTISEEPKESKYSYVTRNELIEIALERKIQNPYKISTVNLIKILEDQDLGLI